MVNLNDPAQRRGVNLLISTSDRNVSMDGRLQYVDAQVDHRDTRGHGQVDPHLVSTPVPVGGAIRQNHARAYTTGSYAALQGAAGHFRDHGSTPILDASGEPTGQLIAVKADVVPTIDGGYAIDMRGALEPSDFPVDEHTWAAQRAATREARSTLARDPSLIMESHETVTHTGPAAGRRRAVKAPSAEDLSAMGRIGTAAAEGARTGVKLGKAVPRVGAAIGGTVGAVIGAGNGVAKEADRRLGKSEGATTAQTATTATPAAPPTVSNPNEADWDASQAFGTATRGFGTAKPAGKAAQKPAPVLITGVPAFGPGDGETCPSFG